MKKIFALSVLALAIAAVTAQTQIEFDTTPWLKTEPERPSVTQIQPGETFHLRFAPEPIIGDGVRLGGTEFVSRTHTPPRLDDFVIQTDAIFPDWYDIDLAVPITADFLQHLRQSLGINRVIDDRSRRYGTRVEVAKLYQKIGIATVQSAVESYFDRFRK